MLRIIHKRKIWLGASTLVVVLSLFAIFSWGLKWGIDFTGGSLLEVKFLTARPSVEVMENSLKSSDLGSLIIQPAGEDRAIIRFQDTTREKHDAVLRQLGLVSSVKGSKEASVEEVRFDAIGPSIGQELKRNSVYAVFFVLIAVVLYISWSFRNVSRPIASWKYGMAALIALFHDVIITIGVFAVLGHYFGIEVNTPFVAAVLTVLGYSVNDTIVVFDRIRENLPKSSEDFENTVNVSLNQTLVRSINTSMTVILVLLAMVFFGGDSIKNFALALAIGVFVGTYSSIFVASPVLVVWERMKKA